MDKFRHKLPKDVLKRHAKDVSKTLVASDYKHNRVEDPTMISEKQEKKVKKYVKDFLDKAVIKHHEHEKRKGGQKATFGSEKAGESGAAETITSVETPEGPGPDDDIVMSDVEDVPASSPERKRKREEDSDMLDASLTPEETQSLKRVKEDEATEEPSPPPPPPPPPEAGMVDVMLTPSQADEYSQEQVEAQRLADEAEQDRIRQEEALERENEEAMREFEMEQKNQHATTSNGMVNGTHMDSTVGGCDDGSTKHASDGRSKQ